MAMQASASEREQKVIGIIETARGKRAKFRDASVTMSHGAGGKATQALVEGLFLPAFEGEALAAMADAGEVASDGEALALTTDAYVVRPLCFPGGSIGELAVNGTVNDLAVSGARALALSLALILEEGLAADVLEREVRAIARAAASGGVEIVAGDTKVVERGHADGMYVCTTGLGRRDPRAAPSPSALRAGDRILLSGPVGEHGMAIMLAREEFELDAEIESDTCSLWPAVDALLGAAGGQVRCMRDPTRGGVASALNELARASSVAMLVREEAVPVAPAVAGAAEILGIDPLYVANEGKLLAFVAPAAAEAALQALRQIAGCGEAADIGEVRADPPGMVLLETAFGGRRVMDQLAGDPLPRIC
jgi:hydrogenase expression/formation protein HypE